MEMEIVVPDQVPVMTLPNVAFFPQALLPLHIFELRYRAMLREVLATNRLFAVVGLDEHRLAEQNAFEPPHRVGTIGIVRACQKNDNGTSQLLLQGLCRVEILEIVTDRPFRRVHVRALSSEPGGEKDENRRLRAELDRLLAIKRKFGVAIPQEMADFLRTVEDPETYVDLAAFSLCESPAVKQKLLETLDVHQRLKLFGRELRREIAALRLHRKLQGNLPDDRISHN